MRLVAIPAHLIEPAVPVMARFLGPVCSRPAADFTVADLVAIVGREEGMLALVVDDDDEPVACGVSQVRVYADGRLSCWVLAMGGTRARDWLHTLRDIEAGARAKGCSTVEFVGRRGWRRLLPDYRAEPCERGVHFSRSLGH